MNRSDWLFKKGLSRRRLQFVFVCGIFMALGGATSLYFNFQSLVGGWIEPFWISFVIPSILMIFGLIYVVMAWRQLRQGK